MTTLERQWATVAHKAVSGLKWAIWFTLVMQVAWLMALVAMALAA